jgi:FG-GAP-like repeat
MNYTVGKNSTGVIATDFNNDNEMNLVAANYGDTTVTVLLSHENQIFSTSTTCPVGLRPQFLTSADYNNDHKLDLIVANAGDNSISLFLGIGDGIFQSVGKYTRWDLYLAIYSQLILIMTIE